MIKIMPYDFTHVIHRKTNEQNIKQKQTYTCKDLISGYQRERGQVGEMDVGVQLSGHGCQLDLCDGDHFVVYTLSNYDALHLKHAKLI